MYKRLGGRITAWGSCLGLPRYNYKVNYFFPVALNLLSGEGKLGYRILSYLNIINDTIPMVPSYALRYPRLNLPLWELH